MKYIDEYRQSDIAFRLAEKIGKLTDRPLKLMEVCGGHTHTIFKYGIEDLLPPNIEMIHGPGCPVCVTPIETLDAAQELALRGDVLLTSFGDMLRVPGSSRSLLEVRAAGGLVAGVYSPLDAVVAARRNPERQVVFLAVGFETTAAGRDVEAA